MICYSYPSFFINLLDSVIQLLGFFSNLLESIIQMPGSFINLLGSFIDMLCPFNILLNSVLGGFTSISFQTTSKNCRVQ